MADYYEPNNQDTPSGLSSDINIGTSATSSSGWLDDISTEDITDLITGGYGLYKTNQLADERESTLQAGFDAQNPFNPYRGLFAGELFNLQQNPGEIVNTPGYQFAYDQGLQSLFAKQASTGNRFSGAAMTETMQYGQGLASQMYNSEMDRLGMLSGASFAPSGGVQTAENLSASSSQQAFDQSWFFNQMFNRQYQPPPSQQQQQFTPWNPSGG